MTAILGISAFYHDSAAALLVDGEIVAAAQEERFSGVKHDASFPQAAIDYCLREAGISAADLDYVGFYEKPMLKFERILKTHLRVAPRGYAAFRKAIPLWLSDRLHASRQIKRGLSGQFRGRVVFAEHHQSHAASAFFPSPFAEAAVLTVDGVGEWATSCRGQGNGNTITLTDQIDFPHSLGLLYSAFTYYLGFRVNSGEYKVMGLAPYGTPRFRDLIFRELIAVRPDGSFRLNMDYFAFDRGLRMISPRFSHLFGEPPRRQDTEITEFHQDVAASIQAVTEEILLEIAHRLHQSTGLKNLVLAGGVALNCVAAGRILRETSFEHVWVQPAAGDAGGSLGVAYFIWHQLLDQPRSVSGGDRQQGSLLGPAEDDGAVASTLCQLGASFQVVEDEDDLCRVTAQALAEGKIVGWFQGRMEFGPRALGNRSILADPRDPGMQARLNKKIKFRESFRPFAPAILADQVANYFNVPDTEFPYMTITAKLRAEHFRSPRIEDGDESMSRGSMQNHSLFPAVTHVDGSSRIQTVDRERNPLFHRLLTSFYELTGCPLLVNTSFNIRGQPIVATAQQAYECLCRTEMDMLVIGRHLLHRREQSAVADEGGRI